MNQNPGVSTKYELYAMMEHLSHDIWYVRSGETWQKFDAEVKVTKVVTKEYVLTRSAYILFYARGTPTDWLGEGPVISINTGTSKSCVGEEYDQGNSEQLNDDDVVNPVLTDAQEDDELKQQIVDQGNSQQLIVDQGNSEQLNDDVVVNPVLTDAQEDDELKQQIVDQGNSEKMIDDVPVNPLALFDAQEEDDELKQQIVDQGNSEKMIVDQGNSEHLIDDAPVNPVV